MNFSTLNNLIRDPNQFELYDMFVFDFSDNVQITIYKFEVRAEHEMRLDLISQEIYTTDDYVDFLCNLNSIANPLNVMQGDTILYCSINDMDSFTVKDVQSSIVTGQYFLNADKSSKSDPNRTKYINNGYTLSPVLKNTPSNSATINGNKIIITNK